MTTALDGAHRAIEIITALTPNWSDHPDVAGDKRCAGGERRDELRIRAALAIRVVIQLPGARVVDQAIVRIVSSARTRRGEKATIAR